MVRARSASSCVGPRWRRLRPSNDASSIARTAAVRRTPRNRAARAAGGRHDSPGRAEARAGRHRRRAADAPGFGRGDFTIYAGAAAAARRVRAALCGLPDRRRPETRPLLGRRHPRAADLARLRRALGDDAVWCIDPPAFSKCGPASLTASRSCRGRTRFRRRAERRIGATAHRTLGWHWAWAAACDLPGLVGVLIRNSRGGELAAWWKARGFRWLWTALGRRLDRRFGGHPGGLRRSEARLLGRRAAASCRPDLVPLLPAAQPPGGSPGLPDPRGAAALLEANARRRRRVGARRKPLVLRGEIAVALCAPRLVHAGRADRLQPSLFRPFSCCNSISTAKLWEAQKVWHDKGAAAAQAADAACATRRRTA